MFRRSISVAVVTMLLTASAQAAHLSNVQGTVLINRGGGFQPVTGDVKVLPGDRIDAREGSAFITYDNGCTARVGPGVVATVLSVPPVCNGSTLIIGGLVIAGGTGLAIALSQGNAPASP
ncbi:MAG: hypothetical protein ACLPPF_22655 [Rhodomicrobium sp.]